jgi:regulator of nonsense transcripts 1
VISNRDTESMRLLDQWLEYVDTEQTLPLFEKPTQEYNIVSTVGNNPHVLGSSQAVRGLSKENIASTLASVTSLSEVQQILDATESSGEKQLLSTIFAEFLALDSSGMLYKGARVGTEVGDTDAGLHLPSLLLNFLCEAPYLTSLFFQSKTWTRYKSKLCDRLIITGPTILTQLVLAAHSAQHAICQHFVDLVQNLDRLTMQAFAELVELISLTVPNHELAVELLFECLEPESGRLLETRDVQVSRFTKLLFATALSHIDKTLASEAFIASPIRLNTGDVGQDGHVMVNTCFRLDAPQQLQAGDHIRMRPSQPPKNAPLTQGPTIDGIVVDITDGTATIRVLHPLPSHSERCLWNIVHGSSFVTTKAMFDAVLTFYDQRMGCCQLYDILEKHGTSAEPITTLSRVPRNSAPELNESQRSAVEAAISHPCTLVWTPPGTGEALVWVSIIEQVMQHHENLKLLVTAPTHASVDTIMSAYIASWKLKQKGPPPLRVSTRVSLSHLIVHYLTSLM